MGKYVLKRLVLAVITLFIIMSLTFILIKLLPFQKPIGLPPQQFAYYQDQVNLGFVARFTEPTEGYGDLLYNYKYSTIDLEVNKAILKNLEKNPEFNEFLNRSINEIYSLFINDNYKEIISNDFNIDKEKIDFENLAGTIEELREQGYDEKYLEQFKHYAQNINLLMDKTKKRSPNGNLKSFHVVIE